MKITVEMLRTAGACQEQVEVFEREWGAGGEVTLAKCLRAAVLGLDLDWAAKTFFSAPALEAYGEAKAPAWEAYEEATALAWKAFREARAWAFWQTIQDQAIEAGTAGPAGRTREPS